MGMAVILFISRSMIVRLGSQDYVAEMMVRFRTGSKLLGLVQNVDYAENCQI